MPKILRSVAGVLRGDEETLGYVAWLANGRALEAGETVSFEIDIATIGRILELVAEWSEALTDQTKAMASTNEAAEKLVLLLRHEREKWQAPRIVGARASAAVRRDKRSEFEDAVVSEARRFLAAGHPRHEIASKIAKNLSSRGATHDSVVRRVRAVLKKSGI